MSSLLVTPTVHVQVDCVLFSHLVDLKDSTAAEGGGLKQSYEQLFKDVRQCVDLCHRDGVIKDRVAEVSQLMFMCVYNDSSTPMSQLC